jgi:putative hydrolase of the HAD superfamily
MTRRYRAVGFDLGETLVLYGEAPLSWQPLYEAALREVAGCCGCEATPAQLSEGARILAGYNTRLHPRSQEIDSDEIFGAILEAWDVLVPPYLERAAESFFGFFQQSVSAYDEAAGVLHALRRRRIKTGVLTDVPYGMKRALVMRDLESVGLSPWLDVVLTSGEVGWRKPEPAGYLRLADELGVPPAELLYAGNERKDVEGARRAGMDSVLIVRRGEFPEWGQSAAVRCLDELLPYVSD